MADIAKELGETSKLLKDPKYKAELDAIAAKMKALDAKFKANLKVTKWSDLPWKFLCSLTSSKNNKIYDK